MGNLLFYSQVIQVTKYLKKTNIHYQPQTLSVPL
jgi:hypothetical protein